MLPRCSSRNHRGGGKRAGSIACYLQPWHGDIMAFLDLRKNNGLEQDRCRDLFTALWIPDLFMKRVDSNANWSLFSPSECPGLTDTCGDQFEALYCKYEEEGRAVRTLPAQQVWTAILTSQIETGTPYMLYKDTINRMSNQKNSGLVRSSNLCAEIVQVTSQEEIAVCNLASINVSAFAQYPSYDFQGLADTASIITRNLNKIIDLNFYPVPEAKNSNLKHRPLGIGVQGLSDAFMMMKQPFDSEEAALLNEDIAEAIYFGAVRASIELAKQHGPYDSYQGSPASQGLLQFHLRGVQPRSGRFDWSPLIADLKRYGMRNSLLTAQMPTASTSQILGRTESVEALTSNLYSRRTSAGDFIVLNAHLVQALEEHGLWTPEVRNELTRDGGSVQKLAGVPASIKALFKTAWEIKQRVILDQASGRSPYVDQSQSTNIFIAEPNISNLTSMHFYGWRKGLKTGMYYLRTATKAKAIQFTVDKAMLKRSRPGDTEEQEKDKQAKVEPQVCTREMREAGCISCSG